MNLIHCEERSNHWWLLGSHFGKNILHRFTRITIEWKIQSGLRSVRGGRNQVSASVHGCRVQILHLDAFSLRLLMLSAWAQTSFSALQIKERSLQRMLGLLFDPDKPPRRDNPLKRPHSLPAAGSYSFILIIRQTPPLLAFCGKKPLRHKEEAVRKNNKAIKRTETEIWNCRFLRVSVDCTQCKGLDTALQDICLTEPLLKDLWPLPVTLRRARPIRRLSLAVCFEGHGHLKELDPIGSTATPFSHLHTCTYTRTRTSDLQTNTPEHLIPLTQASLAFHLFTSCFRSFPFSYSFFNEQPSGHRKKNCSKISDSCFCVFMYLWGHKARQWK